MKCEICNSDKFTNIERIDMVQCENCGLFIKHPQPTEDFWKNKNKNFMLSACHNQNSRQSRINDAHFQLDTIEKYTNVGSLFDVGASAGFFVKTAQDRGWEVDGNEISDASINWCKQNYNIELHNGFFETLNLTKKYDVIVFWNTFEHLVYPRKTLKKCQSILNDDGLLYIRVPNRDISNIQKFYEDQHTFEFNPANLESLLIQENFIKEFIDECSDVKYNSMDLMFRKN